MILFTSRGWSDYTSWTDDRKAVRRIHRLLEEVVLDPGLGAGKIERLAGDLSGGWSRRIDQEHRLVHTFTDGELVVVSARYHY